MKFADYINERKLNVIIDDGKSNEYLERIETILSEIKDNCNTIEDIINTDFTVTKDNLNGVLESILEYQQQITNQSEKIKTYIKKISNMARNEKRYVQTLHAVIEQSPKPVEGFAD